jgi:hypothetical protein
LSAQQQADLIPKPTTVPTVSETLIKDAKLSPSRPAFIRLSVVLEQPIGKDLQAGTRSAYGGSGAQPLGSLAARSQLYNLCEIANRAALCRTLCVRS